MLPISSLSSAEKVLTELSGFKVEVIDFSFPHKLSKLYSYLEM